MSFASEPTVADLDADGHAEVIFTSWVQKGSGQTGKLYILDYLGNLLQAVNLPPAFGGDNWNGALPAPTLANLDSDPDLEVVINSAHSGVVAYDLPGTANAIVQWGTGRGSYRRSGVILQGKLHASVLTSPPTAAAGGVFTFTTNLSSSNSPLENVNLAAVLPEGLDYAGGLTVSSGTGQVTGKTVSWSGGVGILRSGQHSLPGPGESFDHHGASADDHFHHSRRPGPYAAAERQRDRQRPGPFIFPWSGAEEGGIVKS